MDSERNSQDRTVGGSTSGTSGVGSGSTGMGAGSSGLGSSSSGLGASSAGTGAGASGRVAGTSSSEDAGIRAGSYDRKFNDNEAGDLKDRVGDKVEEGRERMHEALDTAGDRAGDAFETGRNRVAGQLETIGDRLEERARTMEDAGGVQRRAGQAARRASEALDGSAEYIRSHDAHEMRDDLERAIRERPLFSVGMAVGAGFLLARLMRD
ncbi:MAG TPA: hypothetical protein VK929_02070 [Longimicrobiales bacterium]|nr:hypothetical protein [Longimicrobiales bacterium]